MRKYIFVALLAVLVVLSFAAVSFATDKDMECPMMKGDRHGMMGMCPMHCMMMKSVMEKEMVATEDGSVVVLAGNKLMKYDKNLELKKEVELKYDTKEACDKMCANCPMCQAMKGKETQPKTEQAVKKIKK